MYMLDVMLIYFLIMHVMINYCRSGHYRDTEDPSVNRSLSSQISLAPVCCVRNCLKLSTPSSSAFIFSLNNFVPGV